MKDHQIAACSFPSTILFLDDNVHFLKELTLHLRDTIAYKLFYKPHTALQYLQEEYHPCLTLHKWVSDVKDRIDLGDLEQDEFTHSFIDMDIFSIHKTIYIPNRFSEIAAVVVDYSMPSMNGLEFCQAIEDLPMKKIVLTGQATHETAVKGFNAGIIDKFVMKGETNFSSKLLSAIDEMQQKYFKDATKIIINNLAADPQNCLGDPVFIEFFEKIIRENEIVEYYLIKETGSFLLLNVNGEISWLVVKNDREMTEYFEIASDHDAPKSIVEALKMRKKIIFLFSREDEINVSVGDWKNYMHPAKNLKGKYNDYYYAYLKGPMKYAIRPKQINSYQNYLADL